MYRTRSESADSEGRASNVRSAEHPTAASKILVRPIIILSTDNLPPLRICPKKILFARRIRHIHVARPVRRQWRCGYEDFEGRVMSADYSGRAHYATGEASSISRKVNCSHRSGCFAIALALRRNSSSI